MPKLPEQQSQCRYGQREGPVHPEFVRHFPPCNLIAAAGHENEEGRAEYRLTELTKLAQLYTGNKYASPGILTEMKVAGRKDIVRNAMALIAELSRRAASPIWTEMRLSNCETVLKA